MSAGVGGGVAPESSERELKGVGEGAEEEADVVGGEKGRRSLAVRSGFLCV